MLRVIIGKIHINKIQQHLKKMNKNVESIMLEVNRTLYLKEGTHQKSENYKQTKKVVQEYLQYLKQYNNL
jgi:hypothetical protein